MNFQKFSQSNYFVHKKISEFLHIILLLHQLFILCSEAYYLDNDPYGHKQVLGPRASYVVKWNVNWKDKSVTFQVSAETKGWVGFGLSRDGRMAGSDVIIGGVGSNGKPYFYDAHVQGNRSVQLDDRQDWKLLGAWEKGKRTYLKFTRPMDTCDLQDFPITSDLIVLIWAYGETDYVEYHKKTRGSYPVYMLDPEISHEIAHDHYRQIGPHSNTVLVQRWALTNRLQLPPRPTSVWCSIQRGPALVARHDIVGMGPFLPDHVARQHVDHILIYKCTSPQQSDSKTFFGPYSESRGEECYMNEKRSMPLTLCRELIYAWGRGGKPFYFPEDIGIPIGESQNEYYMLETHYENPKNLRNIEIDSGIEIIFSHRTKLNQASLLKIGYGSFGYFQIPPKSVMNIYGSCGPKCTSAMFPKNGVNVFAAMLRSHSLGRRIRIQHFRGGQELPWIVKDDNYDSEFQQMRLFSTQVTVLPGDQLTTQCTFDSYTRKQTTFSGFSSQDEVCQAFVYVSRRIPFFRCTSEYPEERLLSKYGIKKFSWDMDWHERYVSAPKEMKGVWLGDVIDRGSQRRPFTTEQLQHELQYTPHRESCPNIYDMMNATQNKLFKTFTNDWQQNEFEVVATKTPYSSFSVVFPENVREYHETPHCQQYHEAPVNTPAITPVSTPAKTPVNIPAITPVITTVKKIKKKNRQKQQGQIITLSSPSIGQYGAHHKQPQQEYPKPQPYQPQRQPPAPAQEYSQPQGYAPHIPPKPISPEHPNTQPYFVEVKHTPPQEQPHLQPYHLYPSQVSPQVPPQGYSHPQSSHTRFPAQVQAYSNPRPSPPQLPSGEVPQEYTNLESPAKNIVPPAQLYFNPELPNLHLVPQSAISVHQYENNYFNDDRRGGTDIRIPGIQMRSSDSTEKNSIFNIFERLMDLVRPPNDSDSPSKVFKKG